MVFKVAITTIYKMITFKKGSLTILSLGLSGGITFYMKKVLEGTELKHLLIPIVIFGVGTILYFFFLIFDFYTGVQVARFNASMKKIEGGTKSYKLYRTLWKWLGVMLLSVLMTISSLMVELVELNYLYKIFITFQGTVWLLACGFELHSIGENHKKRFGYKPRLLQFFDRILSLFERRIVEKVNKSFEVLETEPEELEDAAKELEVIDEEIVEPKNTDYGPNDARAN